MFDSVLQEIGRTIRDPQFYLYVFEIIMSARAGQRAGLPIPSGTPTAKTDTPVERSTPGEHDVGAHRQRYRTRTGPEWRPKESYKRGGQS
jgi:hypothetical protein